MNQILKPHHYAWIIAISSNTVLGQWENEIFKSTQKQITDSVSLKETFQYQPYKKNRRNPSMQVGGLQYTKNNEYFQQTNPGETIMGQRIWGLITQENTLNNLKASYTFGAMIQYPFDNQLSQQIQFKPIVQLSLQTKNSTLNVGSIKGHVNHLLPEPVMNYEWALKSPVEYGLSWDKKGEKIQIYQWLNWRQQAILETSQQEIIVGGISANWNIINNSSSGISLSLPFFMIHQHQGGENLKQPQPIQNKNNSGFGLRLSSTNFRAEYYGIQALDLSPQPLQPYKNGFGHLVNLSYDIQQNHRLVVTYWNAREFHAPMSAAIYGCVNPSNPYKNVYNKEIAILRYAYLKRWINNTVTEFRVEPGLDLKTNDFLLSFGLYVKFLLGDWIYYQP